MSEARELEKLEAEARRIAQQIGDIKWARDSAESAQYVGRFFRGRNNYSCPEKPSDYWPWYFKATGNDGRHTNGFSFERDKHGASSANHLRSIFIESHDLTEITRDEYEQAWRQFLRLLAQDEASSSQETTP